jgi:hypothetical protein
MTRALKFFMLMLVVGFAYMASGDITASNQLEVWVDDTLAAASYRDRFDLQYTNGPWLVGVRFELDEDVRQDLELGERIRRRFVEYRADEWSVRAGTYYATFSNGILLRAEEEEAINLDRDLDGVYGSVNWRALDGQAFVGRPRNDETRERDDLLSGIDAGVWVVPQLRLGAGYVRLDAVEDTTGPDIGRPVEELVGANARWVRGVFDVEAEVAKRFVWGQRDPRGGWTGVEDQDGRAYYGGVTVGVPGYTVLVEGKDYYRFDFAYATPPTVNRDERPINEGADERGVGVSLTATPREDLTFDGGASWAGARDSDDSRTAVDLSARKDWWRRGALGAGAVWVEEEDLEGHDRRSYYGPSFEALYYVSRRLSISADAEVLIREDSLGSALDEYTELDATVSLTRAPWGSLSLSVIAASEPIAEYANDDLWIAAELVWRVTQQHELRVRAGEERGGIVCSGGVCRYEPPFSGVKAVLTSRF